MNLKVLGTHEMTFEDASREYDVVDRNIGVRAPRWFISYNQGRPFISDEVSTGFREPMVFHELYEFEILKGEQGRCSAALKQELKLVSPRDMQRYLDFRRDVFTSLLEYIKAEGIITDLSSEVKDSIRYIEALREIAGNNHREEF